MNGQRIIDLLQPGLTRAVNALNRITRQAINRVGLDHLLTSSRLYNESELEQLRQAAMSCWATGELIGRAIPRLRMARRVRKFADFPAKDLPNLLLEPGRALEYFDALVPSLNLEPRAWQTDLERQAFTMVAATTQQVLERVRGIVIDGLKEGKPAGAQEIRLVLDRAGMLPSNPQYCLLPGTLVEGAIEVASQADYDGPAVEIETNAGRRLRVTINHPVLTTRGWKAAGCIQEGEQLVCHGNPVESLPLDPMNPPTVAGYTKRRAVHDQQVPARVEDVFQALLVQGSPRNDVQCPVTPLDFHGDAAFFQGKVNRVRANRVLHDVSDPYRVQSGGQFGLMMRNNVAAVTTRHRGGLLCLRCGGLAYSTLRIGEAFEYPGLLSGWTISPPSFMAVGLAAKIDPRLFHKTSKATGTDVQLFRNLAEAFPGVITTDGVAKVKRIRWTGHIYDLQTSTGFIVSQGIITSNSEMVYRTNVMDAHAAGHDREMADPEMREFFPAWLYSATIDQNSRPKHAKRNGRMYSQRVPFVLVRGTSVGDVVNCRCVPIDLDRWEVEDRLAKGERLHTGVA